MNTLQTVDAFNFPLRLAHSDDTVEDLVEIVFRNLRFYLKLYSGEGYCVRLSFNVFINP